MKIKNIKVYNYTACWREWSFIKIETNKVINGWAECTDTFKNLNGFCGIIEDFKTLILEEDALNIERIIWKLKSKSKSSPGSLIQRVISAIENALWDIKAKNIQKPVYELFGKKKRKEMEIYWSHCGTTRVRTPKLLNKPAITSLKDVKNFCKEINKTDFKVIKTNLAIFKNGPQIYMPGHVFTFENPELKLSTSTLNEIINWIKELNTFLKKDIYIAVDLNFNFHTKDLIKVANSLKNFRIKWLEIDCRSPKTLADIKSKELDSLLIESIKLSKKIFKNNFSIIKVKKIISTFPNELTTSLQRDINLNMHSELETQVGSIVKLSNKYKISLPMYKKVYYKLKKNEKN